MRQPWAPLIPQATQPGAGILMVGNLGSSTGVQLLLVGEGALLYCQTAPAGLQHRAVLAVALPNWMGCDVLSSVGKPIASSWRPSLGPCVWWHGAAPREDPLLCSLCCSFHQLYPGLAAHPSHNQNPTLLSVPFRNTACNRCSTRQCLEDSLLRYRNTQ